MKEKTKQRLRMFLVKRGVLAVCVLATAFVLPVQWCMRGSGAWYRGEAETQERLARGVMQWIEGEEAANISADAFATGYDLFNGEWQFGTYFAAAMGLGQTALEHPEWRERHSELMAVCIRHLLSDRVCAFDTDAWRGQSAMEDLEDGLVGHAAYLGYMNLAMSLHRVVDPDSEFAELNDRITSALMQSLMASRLGLLPTYPGEFYPVDNCSVGGSIGLHGKATGRDYSDFMAAWRSTIEHRYIDEKTGLLIQAVSASSGLPIDEPRGSGTTLGAYMVSFGDRDLAQRLFGAVQEELEGRFFGFGTIREYPRGVSGKGDIDSGPVVLGYSTSATGFAISLARMYGDRKLYRRLYATAGLVGAPVRRNGQEEYVLGGALGNALLFAMLTAPREEVP